MARQKFLLGFVFLCILFPVTAKAGGSVGLGAGVLSSEYKQTDGIAVPVPIINYENDHFYLRGLMAGFKVYADKMHEISLTLSYLPQYYKASRSDSWSMRQLDDRHSTVLAGAAYRLKTPFGTARASVGGDILDHGGGFVGDLAYLYPFKVGPATLSPTVGGMWTSKDYNDYYYGISGKESRKSGLKKYRPDDAFSPFAGLDATMDFTENWSMFLNMRAVFLSDEITDSPMVSEEVKWAFSAGFSYNF